MRAVVWDLGNVLIDWQPARAIAAGVGADHAAEFLAADDFDFMAWNHRPDSGLDWAIAEADVRRSHPHWADAALAYRANFAQSLVGEVPGSSAIVRELHAAGVPQWGLTNWSAELYPHAPARFEVLSLLEDVVVSGRQGVAKPDPEIYARTVARTGLTAGDLVFIDDRASNVQAAIEAGWQGVVFTDADDLRTRLRDLGLPLDAR